MSIGGIFKVIAEKQKTRIKEAFDPKKIRIDADLPLGIKFNSILDITGTSFLTGDHPLLTTPGSQNHTVIAAEKLKIVSADIYRIYLQGNENNLDSYLWLNKSADEIIWFQPYDEIYPQSEDDWAIFCDEERGLLFQPDFIIDEKYKFESFWKVTRGLPTFDSVTALDMYGMTGIERRIESMMFKKDEEYVLASIEENLESGNASISIAVGVQLKKAEVKVI